MEVTGTIITAMIMNVVTAKENEMATLLPEKRVLLPEKRVLLLVL